MSVILRSDRGFRQKQKQVVLERGNLLERFLERLDGRAILLELQVGMSQQKRAPAAQGCFFPAQRPDEFVVSLLRQEFFEPCGQGRTCGLAGKRRFRRARGRRFRRGPCERGK